MRSGWREYISYRIDADVIIGVGVVKFLINFISHYDKNMTQNRCDFIAWRADGSTCRIHPSASGPGKVVIGMPCDWIDKSSQHPTLLCRSSEPTASTSSAEQPAHTFHYHHLHQQDIITARDAQLFLATELDAWQALPHPRLPFCIDMAVNPRGRAHDGRPFFFDAFLNGFS